MRLVCELSLQNETFPCDFRPLFLSFFKDALGQYEEGTYLEHFYAPGVTKPYSFAVWLGKAAFLGEQITIDQKRLKLFWSTSDFAAGIAFYNSLLLQKRKAYPLAGGNQMCLESIAIERETVITKEVIDVSFASPLCVRKHNPENNKDLYYSYAKEDFQEVLQEVMQRQISSRNKSLLPLLKGFSVEPLQCKKTVVRHHRQMIEVTIGQFRLRGDIRILTHFYLSGLGSRVSAGFGYFNIIAQGR
ncbi:MAG: cas6 [Firmicutes bacterium]|nr:cas6 [Bacillota bacterium]